MDIKYVGIVAILIVAIILMVHIFFFDADLGGGGDEISVLPDFVVTDISVAPSNPKVGDTVEVGALIGNKWALAVDAINTMDVEVALAVNDEIVAKQYHRTGCSNYVCPPDPPKGVCYNNVFECPTTNLPFEWDVVKCQHMPQEQDHKCRCVYFVEAYKTWVVQEPGIYELEIIADPDGRIREYDITNNRQTYQIEVG